MSRGIGKLQNDILTALSSKTLWFTTTRELADQLHRSQRQIARAVRSLERRGLVDVDWPGGAYPMTIKTGISLADIEWKPATKTVGLDGKEYPR